MNPQFYGVAIGAIFAAGVYVTTIKTLRSDVNGLGAGLRREIREQDLWRWGLVRTLIEESTELDQAKRFARLLPR